MFGDKTFIWLSKRKVQLIENTDIGLTTTSDTIKYGFRSYEAYKIHKDSIVVRKPSTFKDTIVAGAYLYPRPFDLQIGKTIRENGVRYYEIKKILSYEQKSFAYKDITSMTYIVNKRRLDGCIFCILVPGINIWWFINIMRKKEKTVDMKKWSIVTDK